MNVKSRQYSADAIEARQTIEGRHPEIAVGSLADIADDILREAVIGSPNIKAVLRSSGRDKQERRRKKQRPVGAGIGTAQACKSTHN